MSNSHQNALLNGPSVDFEMKETLTIQPVVTLQDTPIWYSDTDVDDKGKEELYHEN